MNKERKKMKKNKNVKSKKEGKWGSQFYEKSIFPLDERIQKFINEIDRNKEEDK